MLRNKDIIIVGLQPWDIKIGSNCKNIAGELARYNRVLYVNAPIDQISRLRHKNEPWMAARLEIRRTGKNLVRIIGGSADATSTGPTGLWNLYPPTPIDSINWLPGRGLFNFFNRRNNRKLACDIRTAADALSFRDFILFNDSDMLRSYYMKEFLQPALSVYYSRDNLMAVPYFNKHGHELEPRLMEKSTLVCANSVYLANLAAKYNPRSFYVGQGCDLSLFDPAAALPEPADFAVIKRPVIGYTGALLNTRLDLELLEELCGRRRNWSFVFVGPEDEAFRRSALHGMDNVHFPGLKKEIELPSYIAHFDVTINPQRVNEMTIGNYPRKIDEYLAMGKPVVATATETMNSFRPHVHLGTTVEDYIALIGKALGENDPTLAAERMRFARGHTWANSVEAICEAIVSVRPEME
jgi:teichuronic acid biosynthesis glycosyltransferase TuaH